jgi:1-acyl-sn-glycerol-3-phosphate acyltransferase
MPIFATIRGILRLSAFTIWSLLVVPPQLCVLIVTRGPAAYVVPQIWHRGVVRIFGLKVHITGAPVRRAQAIYVSNHISYLDIPVLGSVLKAAFVAKSEVAGWPVFGFLSKLQQTAFINRSRAEAASSRDSLKARLNNGQSLILFPEATSSNGREVLPFRSSFFALAEGAQRHFEGQTDDNGGIYVQPLTVRVRREPRGERGDTIDDYAWYGDMELPGHLWHFAKYGRADIEMIFHPPIAPERHPDRKTLANLCETAIVNAFYADNAQPVAI